MKRGGEGPGFVANQFVDVTGDPVARRLEIRLHAIAQLPTVQLSSQFISVPDGRGTRVKNTRVKFSANARANL